MDTQANAAVIKSDSASNLYRNIRKYRKLILVILVIIVVTVVVYFAVTKSKKKKTIETFTATPPQYLVFSMLMPPQNASSLPPNFGWNVKGADVFFFDSRSTFLSKVTVDIPNSSLPSAVYNFKINNSSQFINTVQIPYGTAYFVLVNNDASTNYLWKQFVVNVLKPDFYNNYMITYQSNIFPPKRALQLTLLPKSASGTLPGGLFDPTVTVLQ